MNVEITQEKKNPLFERTEVEFRLTNKTTPSRMQIKEALSKKLKANKALLVIDIIDQKTGSNEIVGKAKVYADKKILSEVELDYRLKRGAKQEEEAEAKAKAEAEAQKAAETPKIEEQVAEETSEAASESPKTKESEAEETQSEEKTE